MELFFCEHGQSRPLGADKNFSQTGGVNPEILGIWGHKLGDREILRSAFAPAAGQEEEEEICEW